jgi:hypothetical protein
VTLPAVIELAPTRALSLTDVGALTGTPTAAGLHAGELELTLRDAEHVEHRVALRVGDELALAVVSKRSCLGYRPPGAEGLVPCPEGATGMAQCRGCFARSQVLPCVTCDGERCANPLRRRVCVQPENHAVYLASFGPGMTKVGVARWERRHERLAEQGARHALIVARADGQIARRIETELKRAGIADRWEVHLRLRGAAMAAATEELRGELLETLELLRPRVLSPLWREPEEITGPELPLMDGPPPLQRVSEGLTLRAVIVGTVGTVVLLDSHEGARIALDAKALVGHHLRQLSPTEPAQEQIGFGL